MEYEYQVNGKTIRGNTTTKNDDIPVRCGNRNASSCKSHRSYYQQASKNDVKEVAVYF
ncbi:hypothetical protein HMPREF0044_0296 [Gleimia coleocanis DSM 15436]|uniref:Uncharacterized protein n=1 Tax=Gleimia coleocanis DSM 15436 TaxID=525245 RepID=C0VYQ6_9ACTO|nr:hypothetical protein HMPREF0044_0296 [Gleimia coleocanis DSM 15436]